MIISCPACATRFSLDAALLGPAGRSVRCAKCGHKWKQEPPLPGQMEGGPAEDDRAEGAGTKPAPVLAKPSDADVFATVAHAAPDADKDRKPSSADREEAERKSEKTAEIAAAPPRPRAAPGAAGPITIPPRLRPVKPKRRSLFRPTYLAIAFLIGFLGALIVFRAEFTRLVPGLGSVYALVGLAVNPGQDELAIGNLVFKRRFEDSRTVIAIQADLFNTAEIAVRVPTLVAIPFDAEKSPLAPAFPFRLPQETIEPGETITFRALYESPPPGTKSLRVTFLE